MALKLFHTPRHKQFKYSPRYYDERKEELEKQVNRVKREMGVEYAENSGKPYIPNIKGQMRGYFKRNVEQKRKSSFRLVIILAILILAAYLLLYF